MLSAGGAGGHPGGDGLPGKPDVVFVRARLPWVQIKQAEGLYINLDGEPLQGDDLRFEVFAKALG